MKCAPGPDTVTDGERVAILSAKLASQVVQHRILVRAVVGEIRRGQNFPSFRRRIAFRIIRLDDATNRKGMKMNQPVSPPGGSLDGARLVPQSTEAYRAEIREWAEAYCQHPGETKVVKHPNSAGVIEYRRQCLECGGLIPNALKQSGFEVEPPDFDHELAERYKQKREAERKAIDDRHLRLEEADSVRYDAYLRSDAWAKKRAKVLKRDNYICQGCGEKKATEVHHLSYDHKYDELLFELVAVCADCHDRCHPEKQISDADLEPYPGSPCWGCRWQFPDENGIEHCCIFDVAAETARQRSDLCGEKLSAREELK